ncbi:hypothetical protein [Robertkochia aurantiaca]|uniref:hypothetical protein n=1 Tax=Robertkochia aurantiaca TaxID=2873700 RepID=UPI001CCBDFCB|nr:hypothetical protein [Robertkochia sp. 3YJGBD-33]
MEVEYKPIKDKDYSARFNSEFFPTLIAVTIIALISYILTDLNIILFTILGFSIIWGIITHFIVRNTVNRIEINNGDISIYGTKTDTKWSDSDKIENTSIRIKSQGFGRGNVEYYLKIYLSERTHVINKRKEWDYNDLIKIYDHISYNKYRNENKELLKKMKLKAKGYSSFEIAFGKNKK